MSALSHSLSQRDFFRFQRLIAGECGISVPLAKRFMLETRIRRRMAALNLGSFSDYCDLIFGPRGREEELEPLIDAVTVNKTDFFREPAHFELLTRRLVPLLTERFNLGGRRSLRVWSAASSTGEEPYTLAMVLAELANPPFEIEATDICYRVLELARRAVYDEGTVAAIPEELRRKYLLRGRPPKEGLFRVAPHLRQRVRFRRLNLLADDYQFDHPKDIVLCRNVLIYFERATQFTVLQHIVGTLERGGFLLMGHSESLLGLDLPVTQVAPTVYERCA
ncbi:MAG: CheR family methyltransferase [Bryobacteraceae bacterium]|nr:CheR family methyltransferase [Bryobacteraceae bacterium]